MSGEVKAMDCRLELNRAFRTTLIISGALLAGLLLYGLMVELIKARLNPFSGITAASRPESLRYIFYAAAVGAVVLVRFVGRTMFKPSPEEDPHHLIARLARATVLTASLGELPAVFGLGLFLLTGSSRDFYILGFVSFFLEFMYFPRLRVWQDTVRERFPQQGI
jgi:hypothetical protein